MKHSKRILAYSAFALIVMLAAVAGIAPAASSVALAQTVPAAPDVTATSPTDTSITLSWDAVSTAVSYEVRAYDEVDGHRTLSDVSAPMTTITDSNLHTGRAYFYWVSAVNSDGGQGPWSARVDLVAGGAPDTPANLAGTAGLLQNSLTWDAVADADHYEVWGRLSTEANNYRELDLNQASNSYTHTGLTAGQSWYYWVRAVDGNGTKGLYAGPEVLTVLTPTPVGAPPSFTATMGNTEITISWGASAPLTGVTITGYEFRHRESGGTWGDWTPDTGGDLTETITGLTNGQAYDFQVRATTSVGPGTEASRSQTPATVPGAPELTAQGIDVDEIRLSWTAPTDNGGAEIDRYRIEILNAQQAYVFVNNVPGNRTSWTHTGRTRATEYTYRIFAENVAGIGPQDSASAFTLANAVQPPSEPAGVIATPGHGMVTLNWGEPAYNGGAQITAYLYTYKETVGGSYEQERSAGTDLTTDIPDLKPGTAYTFAVRARNSAGSGDRAVSASVTVRATAPTGTTTLRAKIGVDDDDPPNPQMTLTWNIVPAAQNGGAPIEDYELAFKKSDDTEWTTWDTNAAGFTGPTQDSTGQSYTATHGDDSLDLEPGTVYEYRVRAFNDADGDDTDGESPNDTTPPTATQVEENGEWSNVASDKTKAVTPSTPTLHAPGGAPNADPPQAAWTLDVSSITVRWTPAADGGTEITSYQLRVSTNDDANERFEEADTEDAVISNIPGSRTFYTHGGLKSETPYFYSIRALNDANGNGTPGEEDEVSGWSASSTAAMTTVAAPGTPGIPAVGGGAATEAAGTGTVTFTWTALPADDQGPLPVTRYEVEYQRTDGERTDDWSEASRLNPSPPTNNSVTHMGREGGSSYQYRVRAVNGNGEGGWSEAADVDIDNRAPDAPILTATSGGPNEIVLQWNVPENNGTEIEGYEIQRWNPDPNNDGNDSDAEWTATDLLQDDADTDVEEDSADITVFTDENLIAGREYFYRMRAEAAGGGTDSAWSGETPDGSTEGAASATTDGGKPEIPSLTAAEGDDPGTVELTWEAPADGGSDITGYEIQIHDPASPNPPWTQVVVLDGEATSHTDDSLRPGDTYFYTMRAMNTAGPSRWSRPAQQAMAGSGNPDVPVLTAMPSGRTTIDLSWTVPNDNGTDITGYQLQRWDPNGGNGGEWGSTNLLGTTPNLVTDFTDSGLTAGTKYYYRVRAMPQVDDQGNADAEEGWSADDMDDGASATTNGDVPERPVLPTAPDGDRTTSSITITWAEPGTGGSAITGYSLQIWDSANSRWVIEATPTLSPYVDRGLPAGTTFHYRVAAVNAHGAGQYSPYVSATTTDAAADEPVLTATATGPNEIRVTWNVPDGNGQDITGYVLNKWNGSDWLTLGNLLPTGHDSSYTLYIDDTGTAADSTMAANTRYDYRIMSVATTASGWAYADAMTHTDVPAKPVLTATADGDDTIKLTWTEPDDNGSDVTKYELQYWDTSDRQWTDLPSVAAPVTERPHTGLEAGTNYTYRMKAQNGVGYSPWSTLVSAKTEDAE